MKNRSRVFVSGVDIAHVVNSKTGHVLSIKNK